MRHVLGYCGYSTKPPGTGSRRVLFLLYLLRLLSLLPPRSVQVVVLPFVAFQHKCIVFGVIVQLCVGVCVCYNSFGHFSALWCGSACRDDVALAALPRCTPAAAVVSVVEAAATQLAWLVRSCCGMGLATVMGCASQAAVLASV